LIKPQKQTFLELFQFVACLSEPIENLSELGASRSKLAAWHFAVFMPLGVYNITPGTWREALGACNVTLGTCSMEFLMIASRSEFGEDRSVQEICLSELETGCSELEL
jgi:hypothetical protein